MDTDTLERRIDGAEPAAPLRKAALLLHSMAEADRHWMLSQVPPVQRRRLDALLAELQALAFPTDEALLREALQAAAAPEPQATARGPSSWTAEQAARILAPEPDALIAVVLSAGSWHWEPALLRKIGEFRAGMVAAARDDLARTAAPALVEATLAALSARVAANSREGIR